MPRRFLICCTLLLAVFTVFATGCRTRNYSGESTVPKPPPAAPVPVVVAKPKPVAPTPAASWYIPRTAWAVEAIRQDRLTPMGRKPYRITVHHTSEMNVPFSHTIEVLREVEREHIAGAGKNEPFACIGYHFVIARDGKVYEGRPIRWQGAHSTGNNNIGNIGICLVGDFEHERVPQVQRLAMTVVLDRLCKDYGISPSDDTVCCHKDFKPTDCPGQFLEPLVRAYANAAR